MNYEQQRLLTPGPLALANSVKRRMLIDLGSRDSVFRAITREVREDILWVAGAKDTHTVIPIQGSGTFALEAALIAFMSSSSKALVCVNGIYGERICAILARHGLAHLVLPTPATQIPDVARVAEHLEADPRITHLCFVHCETTTGILNPFRELLRCARERGVMTIVDSMSAFGAVDINASRDGFDVLVSSGNKCLEAPPGVAFVLAPKSAMQVRPAQVRSFCLDLFEQWRHMEASGEWRTTPPTHVVQALHMSLQELRAEGIAARRERYWRVQARVVSGFAALGIEPILAPELRSPICVAFRIDALRGGADAFDSFYDYLVSQGLYIYAKAHAETRSFRVGCIGRIPDAWIDRLVECTGSFVAASCTAVRGVA
jgi:2-aminoethylphosphonate-pyruvate transaminase